MKFHRKALPIVHLAYIYSVPSKIAIVLNVACACMAVALAGNAQDAEARTSSPAQIWRQSEQLRKTAIEQLEAAGLEDQIKDWFFPRDPNRLYIFMPIEDVKPIENAELKKVLKKHAESLFELTKKLAAEKNGNHCYRLLHEILFYDPDHQVARDLLGHRKDGDGWNVSSDRLKVRKGTRKPTDLGWPAKSYLRVSTSSFEIVSQASPEQSEFLAKKLELWQQAWRQSFFEFWGVPSTLCRNILEGKPGRSRRSSKKFRVVFFRDKEAYVDHLRDLGPVVELSTGYYSDKKKKSYFYAGSDLNQVTTWRHEVTHQLFQETRASRVGPFVNGHLWLGEGIAIYFESLIDFGAYVTVGGFDAERLQNARSRRLKEQYYVPSRRLSNMTQAEFQSSKDVGKLYTQGAGLTHFLMHHDFGRYQSDLNEYLQLSYKGRLRSDSFQKVLGLDYEALDEQYEPFLKIKPDDFQFLLDPTSRIALSLVGAKCDQAIIDEIGKCLELRWLDFSGVNLSGLDLRPLANCKKLDQLFLTGCVLDSGAFAVLREFPQLSGLYLEGTSVTDKEMGGICKIRSLVTLALASTRVTDASATMIMDMSNLKLVDLRSTGVSDRAVLLFRKRAPHINVDH